MRRRNVITILVQMRLSFYCKGLLLIAALISVLSSLAFAFPTNSISPSITPFVPSGLTITSIVIDVQGTISFEKPGNVTLPIGGTYTNTATSSLSGESYGTISYSSSNNGVATVDESGTVTSIGQGSTTITATQAKVLGVNAPAFKTYTVTVPASVNPDLALVAADLAVLTPTLIKGSNANLANITTALAVLPATGANGSTISWSSSNTVFVSNDGQTLNRPIYAAGDASVTLTATVSKGAVTTTKVFALTVKKLSASTIATVTSGTYTVSAGGTSSETITNVPFGTTKAAFLAAVAKGEANQSWNDTSITDPVANGNTLAVTAEDATTRVTYTVTVNTNPDIALVFADNAALTDASIKGSNTNLANVTVALQNPLPATGANGSRIFWSSSNTAFVSNDGQTVNRPIYSAGDARVTLRATVSKGAVTTLKVFVLIVKKLSASINATVTSGTYTVSAGGTSSETITNVPYGTTKAAFLAVLTKGDANQSWNDTSINDPVATGNTLVVTAQDATTRVTYTVTVNANPDIALVAADKAALTDVSIKGSNADLANVTVGLTNPLPATGANGSTITWVSSNPAVVSNNGQTVTRPSAGSQDATLTLTATITKGAVSDTKLFTLTVLKQAASSVATVTSATYTVSAGGTSSETITNVPYGTTRTEFLAALTKGEPHQIWMDTSIPDPVVTGTILEVFAQDATTRVSYTVTVNPNSDITLVEADKAALTDNQIKGSNTDLANVIIALQNPLPATGANGSTITWVSSNPAVVSNNGQTVTRPSAGSQDATLTLTATITKGAVSDTKVFPLTVLKQTASTVATVTSGTYTVSAGGTSSETITNVPYGTTRTEFLAALTKGDVNQSWNDTSINDPVAIGNTLEVTAEDGITRVTYTIIVSPNPNPDIALVAADKAALTDFSIKGGNTDLGNVTVSLTNPLPATGANGSAITWESGNTAVVSHDGQAVTRPLSSAGDATVTMTATITKGTVSDTKVFTLTVLKQVSTPPPPPPP